jgi:thiamine-monophosphate kinase
LTEFDFIEHCLKPNAGHHPDVILGIGDDCAVLRVPPQQELVISTDTVVAGVHFPEETSPYDIGFKSIAVSLSDLAAMGATPIWVMASFTFPHLEPAWIQEFCAGFFALLNQFKLQLIGGDTSQGPLSITTQVFGYVPPQQALRRDGAKIGDLCYVTGPLGDAGLALRAIQNKIKLPQAIKEKIVPRLNRPEPRIPQGLALRGLAHSAIDISDGLVADLGHILTASGVGAKLWLDKLPLSRILQESLPPLEAIQMALSAGDDYELCFTIPPAKQKALEQIFAERNWDCFCVGVIESGSQLQLINEQGEEFHLKTKAYQHFFNNSD